MASRATGRIAFIQEGRIRLVTPDGRGFLLTLGHSVDEDEVRALRRAGAAVEVEYEGQPGMANAVATRVGALVGAS